MNCGTCFKVKRFFKSIKWSIQRARRGYGDNDAWNMNVYLSKIIVEMLNEMLITDDSHPADFSTEEWQNTLRKMRHGFSMYLYTEEEMWQSDLNEEQQQRLLTNANTALVESLKLFSEHFGKLWF